MPPHAADAATARRIDELCDRFESDWRTGQWPQIEDMLREVDGRARNHLLRELLLLEWEFLLERGQPPQVGEYYRRFPTDQRTVRDTFAEFAQPGGTSAGAGLEEYMATLAASGLVPAEELRTLQDSLPAERRPRDALSLTSELVRHRYLTPFQAKNAFQGRAHKLVLGDYVLLECIGRGGMGEVYRAKHRPSRRIVAIKLLYTCAREIPEARARFTREAEVAVRLSHRNIVTAFDFGDFRGVPYLVMEYVDGANLSSAVKKAGPFRVSAALECTIQAAEALDYAHSQGIVHRDVKPANLMLDKSGAIRILDMGLALRGLGSEGRSNRLTAEGILLGTVEYMAPEQAGDARLADARADVYSLGCTLYYLLVGRSPYMSDAAAAVMIAHREAEIPSLCETRPDVPPQLNDVYHEMVAKDPADRIQQMRDLVVRLKQIAADLATSPQDG